MVKTKQKQYPECEKLAKVRDKSQIIGSFLEWLRDTQGYIFAKWDTEEYQQDFKGNEELYPIYDSIESLLANYFEIDMNKVEQERQQILDDIRKTK